MGTEPIVKIVAIVRGTVRFPSLPDHVGQLGLCGGEDVFAERRTFRSPTEAARWAERVIDEEVRPRRWQAYGPMPAAHLGPDWHDAVIEAQDDDGNAVKAWEHNRRTGGRWVEVAP